ncbi:hypothetical protein AXG93_2772s1080 [Marchantia polymorpha subsp. ruderalis]|uniref:Uncharacterized protein n=1 Tax=Marchantia polymorpha subsp. ruderalis TaxID=1480154 RepID=A0A176WFZ8_MARPO|nr:hypothetical protein AXG93_2772s1080 [Marchantia polymorpha subsp. ruderalis]
MIAFGALKMSSGLNQCGGEKHINEQQHATAGLKVKKRSGCCPARRYLIWNGPLRFLGSVKQPTCQTLEVGRRFLAANQMRTGPTLGLNSANVTFIGPISNYPRHMEEGRLSEIPASPPPKKNPGVAVIMPGEAEASFIAEPTTPVETAPNNSSHPDRSQEESSGTILIAHTKT